MAAYKATTPYAPKLFVTEMLVTAAQLKSWTTTNPIPLISAPGANRIISVLNFTFIFKSGGVAFTATDGSAAINYGPLYSGSRIMTFVEAQYGLTGTTDYFYDINIYNDMNRVAYASSTAVNAGVYLNSSTDTVKLTGSGTFKVVSTYKILETNF